jgi:hypothetical protein
MSNDPDSPPERKPSAAESRQAERAAALRANLVRRKAQARGRSDNERDPPPKPAGEA